MYCHTNMTLELPCNPPKVSSKKVLLYLQTQVQHPFSTIYRYKYCTKINLNSKDEIPSYLKSQGRDTKLVKSFIINDIEVPDSYLLYIIKHMKQLVSIQRKGVSFFMQFSKAKIPSKIYKTHRLKALESTQLSELDRRTYRALEKTVSSIEVVYSGQKIVDPVTLPFFRNLKNLAIRIRQDRNGLEPLVMWTKFMALRELEISLKSLDQTRLEGLITVMSQQPQIGFLSIKVYQSCSFNIDTWKELFSVLENSVFLESFCLDATKFRDEPMQYSIKTLGALTRLKILRFTAKPGQSDFEGFVDTCKKLVNLRELVFENYTYNLLLPENMFQVLGELKSLEKLYLKNKWKSLESNFHSMRTYFQESSNLQELGIGAYNQEIELPEDDWKEFCKLLGLCTQLRKLELAFGQGRAPYRESEYEPLLALASTLKKLDKIQAFGLHLRDVGEAMSLDYLFRAIVGIPLLTELKISLPPIVDSLSNKTCDEARYYICTMKFLNHLELFIPCVDPVDVKGLESTFLRRLPRLKYIFVMDIPISYDNN